MSEHCFSPNWPLLHCPTQVRALPPLPQTPSLNATCDLDVPMCLLPPELPFSVSIQMRSLKSAHSFQVVQAPLFQGLRASLWGGGSKRGLRFHVSPRCCLFLHFCLSPLTSVLSGSPNPTSRQLFSPRTNPAQILPFKVHQHVDPCYLSKIIHITFHLELAS